jgi:hypothetical protein
LKVGFLKQGRVEANATQIGFSEVYWLKEIRVVEVSPTYNKPSGKAPVIDPGDEPPCLFGRGERPPPLLEALDN